MSEELYYIQDTRSFCGNSCFWWCVDGHGYTCNVDEAWKVTREQAEKIIRNRPGIDVAWPCSMIDAGAERHFDTQKLRGHTPMRVPPRKVVNTPEIINEVHSPR